MQGKGYCVSWVVIVGLVLSAASPLWAQRAQPTSTGNPDADRLFVAVEHLAASGKGSAARALLNQIATQHAATKAGVRARVEWAFLALSARNEGVAVARPLFRAIVQAPAADNGVRAEQARAQYGLAWCYVKEKNYAQALSEFQKVVDTYTAVAELEVDESTPVEKAAFQIANCYLAGGQRRAGINALLAFITIYPDSYLSFRAQEKLERLGVLVGRGRGAPGKASGNLVFYPRDPSCGPKALAAALGAMGMMKRASNGRGGASLPAQCGDPSLIQELAKLAGTDPSGTTFAGLKKAAEAKGLVARGYYTDLAHLRALPTPFIAWVNRNHYVAVLSVNGNEVKVFDPANRRIGESANPSTLNPQPLTLAVFEKMWDGYALVVWKKGQPDPVMLARARMDAPKKLAKNVGIACLFLLGCLVPLSAALGYPLSAGLRRASLLRGVRSRHSRFFTRLTALSLLCAFVSLWVVQPALATVNRQLSTVNHFVPEYPALRPLTSAEMAHIKGSWLPPTIIDEPGAPECWQDGIPLIGCFTCGSGGGVGGTPSLSDTAHSGNVFLNNLMTQGGGVVLSAGVRFYLSTQDGATFYANPAIKTNYDMRVTGYDGDPNVTVIDEDGRRLTFTDDFGMGEYLPPAGHHETLVATSNAGNFSGWEMTRKDQTVYTLEYLSGSSPATSRLKTIADPNGNAQTVAYTSSTSLNIASVTDAANRVLTYSTANNVTTISDWASRSVVMDNSQSNKIILKDALNGQTTLNITVVGNPPTAVKVDSLVDPLNRTYTFTYDSSPNPRFLSRTDPNANPTSVAYGEDANGNKTVTVTDEEGHKRSETYDANDNLIKVEVQFTAGAWTTVETRTYDADHNLTRRTNGLGQTWDMTYDPRGNLLTVTNPSVGGAPRTQVSSTYDAHNNRTSFTNEVGKVWAWTFDANSNLTSEQDPVQAQQNPPVGTTYTYDGRGRRTSMTNALGKTWTYGYDNNNNLTSTTDPNNNTTTYGYDSLGRRTSVTVPDPAPNGATTYITYNANDRVTQVTNPDNTTRTTTYNCCVKLSDTDENGKVTQYEYDALNRLIKIYPADDPNKTGTPITMTYYLDGQLHSVSDRKNQTTTFTNDGGHRQTRLTFADTSFEEFAYDAASQLTAKKKQDGNVISFSYDELGRRTGIDYPTGTDPTFTYDDASRRTQMTDATGTYTYTYSDRGEMLSVTYPGGKVVQYAFDAAGQRTSLMVSGYGTTTYLYYDNSALSSFTTPDSKTFSYTYNRNGAVTQQTNGNGTKVEYVYNSRGLLTNLDNKKSDNTVLSSFAYTLDSAGNRTAMTEQDGSNSTWSYDALYQLTREVKKNGAGTTIFDTLYAYDLAQNRTSMTDNLTSTTTNYTYNAMNQMLTAGNISFTYDANGNTASKQANQQTTTYTWDYENKLTRIDYPNSTNNTFTTNADGQRMTANDSGGNRRFIYDGTNVVGEQDVGSGNFVAVYDHSNGGLARQTRGTAASYYQYDGLGSTRKLTDANQAVTDTTSYDAWGNVLSSTGTTVNAFKYVGSLGYYADGDSGLMLLGARYYGASVGRFVTLDPARHGQNWYAYANNNPVNVADPSGLIPWYCYISCAPMLVWPPYYFDCLHPCELQHSQCHAHHQRDRCQHPKTRADCMTCKTLQLAQECCGTLYGDPVESQDCIDRWLKAHHIM